MWRIAQRIVFAGVACFLAPSALFAAADVLTIGFNSAQLSDVASVPVYIRDVSGTSLDVGGSARIQVIQFTANFTNAALIDGCSSSKFPDCSVVFRPDGVLAGHTPATADLFKGTASVSFTYSYSQVTDPLAFHADAATPGDLIGYLDVKLVPGATKGARIDISLDSGSDATFLANQLQAGKITETKATELELGNGAIIVGDCDVCHFTVPASGSVGSSVTFVATSCIGDTFTWTFGDGVQSDTASGAPVTHTYSQAGTYAWSATSDVCFKSGNIIISSGAPACSTCTVTVPSTVAAGTSAVFVGNSCAGDQFTWSFGDNASFSSTSGQFFVHTYATPGSYHWETTSGFGCSGAGDITVTCDQCVALGPVHAFAGVSGTFLATSCDGETFTWTFGDGSPSSTVESGRTVSHAYTVAGGYTWTATSPSCQKNGRVQVTPSGPPARRRVGP